MSDYYLLKDEKIVPVDNLMEWAKAFEEGSRRVAETEIGNQWISTVFLGIDHSWNKGKPVLFETMIFSTIPHSNNNLLRKNCHYDDHDFEYFQTRCCTYTEAVIMHGYAVIEVNNYYKVKSAMSVIKAGVLAIATIIAIYFLL